MLDARASIDGVCDRAPSIGHICSDKILVKILNDGFFLNNCQLCCVKSCSNLAICTKL